jgi:peptidoglycan/LPS O-acetylase OafA/YrhL
MSQTGTDQLSNDVPGAGERRLSRDWTFGALLLAGVILALYVLLWRGVPLFKWVAAYLPFLLPLAVTVLSIFTRAADIRNYESVLKFANDLAIGIISFDIWAISASRSDPTGRVLVNPEIMISGDFVIPLLLVGLLIAVGCVVLTQYTFQDTQTKQRWLLVGLITAAIVYVAPFGLVEHVPQSQAKLVADSHRYTVVIPY